MYSRVFNFRFTDSLSPAQRMHFLAELFRVTEQTGARETDIYWYRLSHDGRAEFYSSKPDLTTALERRLEAAEASGLITQQTPGMRGGFAFLGRVVSGLLGAAFRAVWPGRSREP